MPAFERVGRKRTVSRADLVVEEYARVIVFIRAASRPLSTSDARRQFSK